MIPQSHPVPVGKGELEYGSILPNGEGWRLRKFDAGMGETEYRIFKNEKFFAQFENRKDADIVMGIMTCNSQAEREAALDEINTIQTWALYHGKQELRGIEFVYTVPAIELDFYLKQRKELWQQSKQEKQR